MTEYEIPEIAATERFRLAGTAARFAPASTTG